MKIDNLNPPGEVGHSVARGHTGRRGGSTGPNVSDLYGSEVDLAAYIQFAGARVDEIDADTALVQITGAASRLTNETGGILAVGDVVVIEGTTVVTTTTPQDTRPVGVVTIAGDDGEEVAVQTSGLVDLVNVTASVTADNYLETSTTAGAATESATRRTGSFGVILTSGTAPSALLFGSPDSSGSGAGGAETPFDHGSMGSTETIDVADGTWHRGTLTANCTITVQGFTADGALVLVFEVEQDGTGGWDITWDADVSFVGDDQPEQGAGDVTVFLLFTSQGDSTIYGARVGGGGTTSPLTTKGDLYGYDTADARIPVGSNGYLLVADSTNAQGIVWENPETTGHWEVLMDGAGEPLDNGSGLDWLYVWVP